MKVHDAAQLIAETIQTPVETWGGYSPEKIPFVVYDDAEIMYLNHPNPPAERPEQLTAATSMAINGVETATIPAGMFDTADNVVPLAYHEGFHVYQATAFHAENTFDFFKALAYYPEMDAEYRALCAYEVDLLNRSEIDHGLLAALTKRRYAILEKTPDVLAFEQRLERLEGTASYVEHRARLGHFGIAPGTVEARYGWSRQYASGAAVCRAIAGCEEWQKRVEAGESPSQILMAEYPAADIGDLSDRIRAAQAEIDAAMVELRPMIEAEGLMVQIPKEIQVYRSFSPATMRSMGNGKLLHTQFLKLFLPGGKIEIDGVVLEDHDRGEVRFQAGAWTLDGSVLSIEEKGVVVRLKDVEPVAEGVFRYGGGG